MPSGIKEPVKQDKNKGVLEAHTINVTCNGNQFELAKGEYTTEQLLQIFSIPTGHVLEFIKKGEFIILKAGETLKLKKGMEFVSHAPCGSSS